MHNVLLLFKCTSLGTLGNIFLEFQIIHKLLNAVLVQLQNHSELCILKNCKINYCNKQYVEFIHG